jgi:NTE family protein
VGVVAQTPRKKINLALQGGGAYGAFTWGVLDHILQDARLDIEGLTGASSGAINAILLTDGVARGGAQEARKRLGEFWRAASRGGTLSELQRKVIDGLFWPTKIWLDAVSHYLSPYDFNPLNINPLKELIERFIDFDAVRQCKAPQLFVSATNVETGKLRIFTHDKITAEVIAASACLPTLFHAVEIDGVPYWDGAYLGNPSIFPLFQTTTTEDVLLVQINPLQSRGTPTSTVQIMSRLNEITFNSPLMGELRAIEFVRRLIDQGRLQRGIGRGKYKRVNMHRIVLDAFNNDPGSYRNRLNTDYEFFEGLRDHGRKAAKRFLDAHFDDIGVRPTVDLPEEVQAEWA